MYTAAVSLVRDPVVSFAALAYYLSLLIYYNCFLITISNAKLCHGPFFNINTVEQQIKVHLLFHKLSRSKGKEISWTYFIFIV